MEKNPKKLSKVNTKQEMIEAYNALLQQLQEREKTELKPEEKMQEKRDKEAVAVADVLSSENVIQGIGNLKMEIGKMLTRIPDILEEEVNKYQGIKEAIGIKEETLREIYDIEKTAQTLNALLEAQAQKREEFENEMVVKRGQFNREMQQLRGEWEKEKKLYEVALKEQAAELMKKQQREKEEYEYSFKREQRLVKDKFEDEKAKVEKALREKKETMEKELTEREKSLVEREEEFNELRKRINAFPKELEITVSKSVKETTERLLAESKAKEDLFKRTFDGERNVFVTKIEALEKKAKEQGDQITKLLQQLEKAYQKIEDIAVKTVSGTDYKVLSSLHQSIIEEVKKQMQDK
ncbi:MAG: hypothetical protein KKC11_02025 [Candidatus Omnitrophica bacterium]|nr:hypothetical protein [Candidatus Omnitrophota bacterium]